MQVMYWSTNAESQLCFYFQPSCTFNLFNTTFHQSLSNDNNSAHWDVPIAANNNNKKMAMLGYLDCLSNDWQQRYVSWYKSWSGGILEEPEWSSKSQRTCQISPLGKARFAIFESPGLRLRSSGIKHRNMGRWSQD